MNLIIAFWSVLTEMAPWLLGGFLLAGMVGVLIPKEWVVKVMGASRGWKGILNACLLGVPLPICSCGTIALAAGLRKAGAGKGATAAFLISTPQTGIDSIMATYALMGPVFAVARPLAALATGIVGGVAVDLVAEKHAPPTLEKKCCCCGGHHNASAAHVYQPNFVVHILKVAYVDILGRIAKPLLIGLVISALVTVFVPESFFAHALGGRTYLEMPLMVLLGFPMYVCSTASIPIAASLILKGISPGAAFVFLMVGPTINAASLATVAPLIGRRAAFLYGGVIALGAIACGIIVNLLPFEVIPSALACGGCTERTPSIVGHLSAAILMALATWHLIRQRLPIHYFHLFVKLPQRFRCFKINREKRH